MARKSIMMESFFQHEEAAETIDFSNWEFINQSDAEDSDTDSFHSLENGFVSWSSSLMPPAPPKSPKTTKEILTQNTQQDHDLVFHLNYSNDYHAERILFPAVTVSDQCHDEDDDDDDYREDEDEDEDDDGYGLDDELVPWNVSGKLGRQRMRKLGKRVFAKMSNSKKNPILHVKPGCVYGKHGLGFKA